MTASENQIVVYQPNEAVRLDVRLENETVWLTQELIVIDAYPGVATFFEAFGAANMGAAAVLAGLEAA